MTMNVYSHIELIDQATALRSLPRLDSGSETDSQKARATGTEGLKSVGTSVGSCAAFIDISCHHAAQKERKNKLDKLNNFRMLDIKSYPASFSGKTGGKEPAVGLEPATCGLRNRSSARLYVTPTHKLLENRGDS